MLFRQYSYLKHFKQYKIGYLIEFLRIILNSHESWQLISTISRVAFRIMIQVPDLVELSARQITLSECASRQNLEVFLLHALRSD
jgi:hypothetical protein